MSRFQTILMTQKITRNEKKGYKTRIGKVVNEALKSNFVLDW